MADLFSRGGRQECCTLCNSVSIRLFFHFQCSDSGLALQLTCISVLKDNNINPDRNIFRQHLAPENALLPQRWWLEVGSIKKKRLWQFSSPSLFHFPLTDQQSPLAAAVSFRDVLEFNERMMWCVADKHQCDESPVTAICCTRSKCWHWQAVFFEQFCGTMQLLFVVSQLGTNRTVLLACWRSRQFNSKTVYQKQSTTEGMPHPKPTDLGMTKHSDYFVWKDTSERVARRCDYTVDKKRVNSCVLKHLFLEGVEQPKISPKTPEMHFPTRYLCHVLTISRLTPKKNSALCAVFWNRASRGFNSFINSN